MINYKQALDYIDCTKLNYNDWIKVGMALKDAAAAGADVTSEDYEEWSSTDPDRYEYGEATYHWDTFKEDDEPRIKKETLVWMARQNGFEPIDNIEEDPENDIIRYLRALFEDDEYVGYNLSSEKDGDKYTPSGTGVYGLTSGELQKDLQKHSIGYALGDYNEKAGGWIRINPLDGTGVADKNVTRFRNVLIESDNMPVEEQLKLIEQLQLPARAIVDSGGKSVHAIMRVDARSEKEYKERVDYIFSTLEQYGFDLDTQNKNPSRLSRLPGLKRGKKKQRLIAVNSGKESFEDWKGFIEAYNLHIVNFSDIIEDMPELDPVVIDGILRRGHKMLITAPSKAGKTQLLIELTIALAEGKKWLDFQCKQCKTLYINLEIADSSFAHRIRDTYKDLGYEIKHPENIDILNMRGCVEPLETLADKIIALAKGNDYSVIIIDPVYKVQNGDENAAGDITVFTNLLSKIAQSVNACVIYSHHHSKGAQAGKSAIDRGSGSGVMARDADALIDFLELESDREDSAWRVSLTLREFKGQPNYNAYFNYPIHYPDVDGNLKSAKPKYGDTETVKRKSTSEKINEAFEEISLDGETVSLEELLSEVDGVNSEKTLRNNFTTCNNDPKCKYLFRVRKGVVTRKEKE